MRLFFPEQRFHPETEVALQFIDTPGNAGRQTIRVPFQKPAPLPLQKRVLLQDRTQCQSAEEQSR